MSNPALAGTSDDGGRFYTWGDQQFWSVTTILGRGLPKHLEVWAAKLVAELAWSELASRPSGRNGAALRRWSKAGRAFVAEQKAAGKLVSIDPAKLTDEDLGLRYLKAQPERIRDAAADRGTSVHAAAEDLVLREARTFADLAASGGDLAGLFDREWPEDIAPWMASFIRFVVDWRPQFLAAEATVFNTAQAYAGTLDAIGIVPRLDDVYPSLGLGSIPLVIDYKSGNEIYPDVAMQLAAYARGEFIGLADGVTELPLPAVSTEYGLVLHLRPATPRNKKGYRLRLVRIGADVFAHFLYVRENVRWVNETSRLVLGEPISLEVA